ncbi:MAG: exodeoxyribonuclease VII large subunit [Campylobacterales bacterium]
MNRPLTVSELNAQIKAWLEATFSSVVIEGEISNFTAHTSGHWYFSLKDEESSIRCVMFRGNNSRVKFRPANGQKVLVTGGISLYTPRGEYQVMVQTMEPSGIGSLMLAYEQLKAALQARGWFDAAHKKPLPKFPTRIALITSATGAAIEDMKRVAAKRWPLVRLELFNTLVQGEGAAPMIARHIRLADTMGYDIIVVGRGGGSIEDLWAFNDEEVARAIWEAKTPIISAVGHEIDYVISDFVADVRAPTPSAAMEMALPDRFDIAMMLDEIATRMRTVMTQRLALKQREVAHFGQMIAAHSPKATLARMAQELTRLHHELLRLVKQRIEARAMPLPALAVSLQHAMRQLLAQRREYVLSLEAALKAQEPSLRISKGYAQVVWEGRPTGLASLAPGSCVQLQDATMVANARIETLHPILPSDQES